MIRRRYIDNGSGGQIHVAETGEGPPVFLIHQTPRSWDEFKEVMEILAGDFHMTAMDLPGMGASSSTPGAPSIEAYAIAAARVIEDNRSGPITVCGHHTGGVVAIELAASRPELVSSLILSSTPWIDKAARQERAKKTPIDTIKPAADGSHLMDLWQQRAPYYPENAEYMGRFMVDALRAIDPAAGHIAVGQYRMEKAIGIIDCPVLLVDHQKDPFASKHTQVMQMAFANAGLKTIAEGRIPLEATATAFSGILKQWIETTKCTGETSANKEAYG